METTVRFMQSPEVFARVERALTEGGVYDEHFRRQSGATWRQSLAMAALAFMCSLGVIELYDAARGDASGVLLAGFVAAIVLFWTRATELRLADRRESYVASLGAQERSAEWLVNQGPTEVSLESDAVSYKGPRIEISFRWESVSEVKRAGRDVVIWTVPGWRLVVAGEAFHGDEDAEDFRREVEHRIAGARRRSTIVTFLADHDLPCVRCRYPLHGVGEPVCPECGRPVGFEDLQRASERAPEGSGDARGEGSAGTEGQPDAPSASR